MSQDLLSPSLECRNGNFILFINGDHIKLRATTIDETVTRPNVCFETPAESNHRPKGKPSAKLGIAAEMPKTIKFKGVFLIELNIYSFPFKMLPRILFSTRSNVRVPNNIFYIIFLFEHSKHII